MSASSMLTNSNPGTFGTGSSSSAAEKARQEAVLAARDKLAREKAAAANKPKPSPVKTAVTTAKKPVPKPTPKPTPKPKPSMPTNPTPPRPVRSTPRPTPPDRRIPVSTKVDEGTGTVPPKLSPQEARRLARERRQRVRKDAKGGAKAARKKLIAEKRRQNAEKRTANKKARKEKQAVKKHNVKLPGQKKIDWSKVMTVKK